MKKLMMVAILTVSAFLFCSKAVTKEDATTDDQLKTNEVDNPDYDTENDKFKD